MDQLDLWIFSTSAKVRQSIALKTYKESKIPKPSHPLGITRLASTPGVCPGKACLATRKMSPANRICPPDKAPSKHARLTEPAKQARQAHRARQASTPGSQSTPSKHARLREHARQARQG